MSKIIEKLSVMSALSLLMVLPVSAQDLFVKKGMFSQFETTSENLGKIAAKQTIGGYPILRISDEMRLMLSKVTYSTGVVAPLGRAVIIATKNKKFHTALDVTANLESSNSSDWTDTPCKREDFLWKRSIGLSIRDVNCVSINHRVNFFVSPTGDFQQIYRALKDEEIEIPPTVITVAFTRYRPSGQRLVYIVEVNPEIYGVERDGSTVWGSSGWYKDFVKRDSKKLEFIERLKKWATDTQDRMDVAFKKDERAFIDLKSLDDYFVEVESRLKNEQANNPEEKLTKLKSLYEKGLLTELQYNDQVKIILSGN
jgi:hypothetical protein